MRIVHSKSCVCNVSVCMCVCRCSLFLIDYDAQELVAKIFDSTVSDNDQPSVSHDTNVNLGINAHLHALSIW